MQVPPVPAAPPTAVVRVAGDHVSVSFDRTPLPDALGAIREATGLDLVVPADARDTVTLTATDVTLDQLLPRLLSALGLGGYAVVYEAGGPATRVIVVGRGAGSPSGPPSGSVQPGVAAGEPSDPAGPRPVAASPAAEPPQATEANLALGHAISAAAIAAIPLARPVGPSDPALHILPFPGPDGSPIPIRR
jgi:hypothetical protein